MVQTVAKESVANRQFAMQEVLQKQHQIDMRRVYLNRAQTLGNLYHHKVDITYQLRSLEKQRVRTTVWSVSNQHVTLKAGVIIPIHAIEKVELV